MRPSSDMAAFRAEFAKSKHVVVLTGAGISAESGVPTFRGAGGFWRKWQATVSLILNRIKQIIFLKNDFKQILCVIFILCFEF